MMGKRHIGVILLLVGFLWAAFATVRQLDVPGDPWQTIPWPTYAAGLLVGARPPPR